MNNVVLISGTANEKLAKGISKYVGVPLTKMNISRFKDGEIYCRIEENIRGRDVFIIQPTPKEVNDNLMQLLIMIDAVKRSSANKITVVMPYYGYARQDRKARSREPITAKLVANLITTAGATRVLTLDLHADQIQGFFDIPVDHLLASPLFASYFYQEKMEELVVVSPDVGGAKRARLLAKALNVPIAIIDKRREKHNEIAEMNVVGDVENKNCILIDDMIDTAGSITGAADSLIKKGAKDVFICATHAILSDPAMNRLNKETIKKIIITDSIAHDNLTDKFKVISVANLLGEAIISVQKKLSVSDLFEFSPDVHKKLTDYKEG